MNEVRGRFDSCSRVTYFWLRFREFRTWRTEKAFVWDRIDVYSVDMKDSDLKDSRSDRASKNGFNNDRIDLFMNSRIE